MANLTYITWDGPEQNYLASLFFPLLQRLEHRVSVIQYTWDNPHIQYNRSIAATYGIEYKVVELPTSMGKLGKAGGVLSGAKALTAHLDEFGSDVVMPRSLMGAAIALASRTDLPIIFDTDGLMADERVEYGGWSSSSSQYRLLRGIELVALQKSKAVLTRTERAKEILANRLGPGGSEKIVAIPNGSDGERFTPVGEGVRAEVRRKNGILCDAPWLVYVGSLGPQYLPHSIRDFYNAFRSQEPSAKLTILTGNLALAETLEFDESVCVKSVRSDEVAPMLAAADLGIALRASSFSQQGVCPIKIGEYLLSGLPILASRNIGDSDRLEGRDIGLFVDEDPDWRTIVPKVRKVIENRVEYTSRCREVGLEHYEISRIAHLTNQVINRSLK